MGSKYPAKTPPRIQPSPRVSDEKRNWDSGWYSYPYKKDGQTYYSEWSNAANGGKGRWIGTSKKKWQLPLDPKLCGSATGDHLKGAHFIPLDGWYSYPVTNV